MSWYWLGLAIGAPTAAGLLLALPFWLSRHTTIGNALGAGIVLLGAVLSIMREFVALLALRVASIKTGKPYHPSPDEFTRYAVYAGIGFAEVFLVFIVSLVIEERLRRRDRARQWR
jgi:hypothetical protein